MNIPLILFYCFSSVVVMSALRVVTCSNSVHAALFLVLTFFSSTGLWLMLGAEFLAMILLLTYVGAVMVFFLFVIMMLDINIKEIGTGFWKHRSLAVLAGSVMITELFLIFSSIRLPLSNTTLKLATSESNTKALGKALYSSYLLPFELASIVLLLAMIAAIALTLKESGPAKTKAFAQQNLNVKREDHLSLVNLQNKTSSSLPLGDS